MSFHQSYVTVTVPNSSFVLKPFLSGLHCKEEIRIHLVAPIRWCIARVMIEM